MKKLFFLGAIIFFAVSCSKNNEVIPEPTVEFSLSKESGHFYANSEFTVTSIVSNAQNIEWDFGDGTKSSAASLKHTYSVEGEYTLKLTACNGDVCKSISRQVLVKDDFIELLTGKSTKTWTLVSWKDSQGNNIPFNLCEICNAQQTFSYTGESSGLKGHHEWLDGGVRTCENKTIQCNSYGQAGHGIFELNLDADVVVNSILIGQAQKVGYQIRVENDFLYLINPSGDELLYLAE